MVSDPDVRERILVSDLLRKRVPGHSQNPRYLFARDRVDDELTHGLNFTGVVYVFTTHTGARSFGVRRRPNMGVQQRTVGDLRRQSVK